MARQQVRIGTRASKLALTQAEQVRLRIAAALGNDAAATLTPISTSGDRITDRRLTEVGGKGLFTKEIEEALLDGRIDCAVHSLKDMPAEGPPGLVIAAIPAREDARDAFLSPRFDSLAALPQGARLGTASLRRAAQALRLRPDLEILAVRGNVQTRLDKLDRGDTDALILAAAGLNRLGLGNLARGLLDPRQAPPAPGQGALAIQTRLEDRDASWLTALRHRATLLAVAAERGALTALEASCRTAMGAYAWIEEGEVRLVVEALTLSGDQSFRDSGAVSADGNGAAERARELGLRLGMAVKARGGAALLLSP